MKYTTNCTKPELFTISELFEKIWSEYLKSDYYKGMDDTMLKLHKSHAFGAFLESKGFSLKFKEV